MDGLFSPSVAFTIVACPKKGQRAEILAARPDNIPPLATFLQRRWAKNVATMHQLLKRVYDAEEERCVDVDFIDQNPIGKSTRSNPSTYVKAYEAIRQLFAARPVARSWTF